MRAIALAAGLLVATAALPARSQPAAVAPASAWRAAVSAALAFGDAEGKRLAMARFSIPSAPTTKKDADIALDGLDRVAKEARDAYLLVERYGSPFWTAAAEIRIGDIFVCQAEKILSIPPPTQITNALPPNARATFMEIMEGLVEPIRDQATQYWERAAAKRDASGLVSGWAWRRLAGATVPDC